MEQLLVKIPDIIQMISLVVTLITIVATVVVRLTPSDADNIAVSKFSKGLLSLLKMAPTWGVNPQTTKLEETLYELREKTNPGVQ